MRELLFAGVVLQPPEEEEEAGRKLLRSPQGVSTPKAGRQGEPQFSSEDSRRFKEF